MTFAYDASSNDVEIGPNLDVTGFIRGRNNRVHLAGARNHSRLRLEISGDDNVVDIQAAGQLRDVHIIVGNHFHAKKARLQIGSNFSAEENVRFYLYNSGNRCVIGDNCMFSNGITVRCGESPHLLFDNLTGEYLDKSEGVTIGDHVWVGEGAYINKRAAIANDSVVGAMSVVTHAFAEAGVIIAGNPARIVRRDITWVRNPTYLVPGSKFHSAYQEHSAQFDTE